MRIFQFENPAWLQHSTAKGLPALSKKGNYFANPKQFYIGVKPKNKLAALVVR